jgi:hypothetical protein
VWTENHCKLKQLREQRGNGGRMKKMSMVQRILGASAFALRLRKFAIVALAAATVAVGSLATIPTASAMPRLCTVNVALADAYIALGKFYISAGYWLRGLDYLEMALDLLAEPCI